MSDTSHADKLQQLGINPPNEFDLNVAFSLGWKAYGRYLGPGALGLFLAVILVFVACMTVVGLLFAVPHLVFGLSMLGYYFTKGDGSIENLFCGFKRYGTVLGATLLLGLMYMVISFVLSYPSYAALFDQFAAFSSGDKGLSSGLATSGMYGAGGLASLLSFLQYPINAYLQGRFIMVYPLIMDKNLPALEALGLSWQTTQKYQWQLGIYLLITSLIAGLAAFIGILGLFIGIFFTLPIAMTLAGAAMHQMMGLPTPDWAVATQAPPANPQA
jgi:hypothetical protein